ncbi:MAG: hypothetical protein M1565_04665 [Actinobacteria bacterium]|nr:hypothetical protein [Actinomycetota bacterium]
MALNADGNPLRIGVSGASVGESPRSLERAVRRQLGVTANWRSVFSSELLRSWWGALAILPLGVAIMLVGPLFPGHVTL